MSLVYGEPVGGKYEEVDDWNGCMKSCYEQENCALVYLPSPSSSCQLFRLGNITKINKLTSSSNKIVAFRTSQPSSTCPVSFSSYKNSSKTTRSFYNLTITSSSSNYLITYVSIICPINSTLLIRPAGPVCIGLRYFPSFNCKLWADASALCGQSGGIGLTGPLNANEYSLFLSWTSHANLLKDGVTATKISDGALFWLDGNSNQTAGTFIFEDNSHNGYSGYPLVQNAIKSTANHCFYYAFRSYLDTDTYPCDKAATYPYCFIGALCRLEPLQQVGNF